MEEHIEEELAQIVAGLSPQEYDKYGPALQDMGLACAEVGQARRASERARENYQRALSAERQAQEDLYKAEERVHDALHYLKDLGE